MNTDSLSWPAVRDLLRSKYPAILDRFASLERIDEATLSDIRLARKAGGFAFEYWSAGGDIKDIDRLLEHFGTMLGSDRFINDNEVQNQHVLTRVLSKLESNAMAAADVSNSGDVWHLSMIERQRLLVQWKNEIDPRTIVDRTAEVHRRHQAAVSRKSQARKDVDMRCLEQQDVIGMTITACAMHWDTLKRLELQIVICEEAGEVMEAQSLCTLFPTVEHAICIGDPLQLRPQVNEQTLSLETTIGSAYRLDESLMERLMIPNPSIPGILPIVSSRLNTQRRMHPEIADLMRATLYPFLKDHESTNGRESVAGMADRVWWFDHQMPEDRHDPQSVKAKSFSNTFEVEMVAGLVEYLVNTNEYDLKDITILTPYNGQLAELTQRFKSTCTLWLSEEDQQKLIQEGLIEAEDIQPGVKVDIALGNMLKLATIDSFQGEESKIVIFSTVRSNIEGRVGFLRTPNRINVGCSRARNGFYIVGNSSLMRGVEMWRQIADELNAKSKIGPYLRACCPRHNQEIYNIQTPEQWSEIPECKVTCSMELPCGHVCKLTCHAPSLHTRIPCLERCEKHHEQCGHRCENTCGVACGDCSFIQGSVPLPCGHEARLSCGQVQAGDVLKCEVILDTIQLGCGHRQDRRCCDRDEPLRCKEICHAGLDCGHQCEGNCGACTSSNQHSRCKTACTKLLDCGHYCLSSCHKGKCPPCSSPCRRSCQHRSCTKVCSKICDPCVRPCNQACPHRTPCTTMCCLPCDTIPCNEPCTKLLICGHLCPGLCGEWCCEVCSQCMTGAMPSETMIYLACGHQFNVQALDEYVDLCSIFSMDCNGRIIRVRVQKSIHEMKKPSCPSCGKGLEDVQRYSLLTQLLKFEDNIDRVLAKFGRKMHFFMDQMHKVKINLNDTYKAFERGLRSGPLTGKMNDDLVRYRSNALAGITHNIQTFRGKATIL